MISGEIPLNLNKPRRGMKRNNESIEWSVVKHMPSRGVAVRARDTIMASTISNGERVTHRLAWVALEDAEPIVLQDRTKRVSQSNG